MNLQEKLEKMRIASLIKKAPVPQNMDTYLESIRLESFEKMHGVWRAEKFDKLLEAIPPVFQHKTFDDFKVDYPEQAKIKRIASRFIETFPERLKANTRLLFAGLPGTGKTFLSAIMCQMLARKGFTVRYESSLQFLRLFREKNFQSVAEFAALLKTYREQFLVIDEITESRVTGDEITHWEKEMLFALIDMRYQQEGLCALVITNRSKEGFCKRLGERIAGRITQNGITAVFDWPSYRKK